MTIGIADKVGFLAAILLGTLSSGCALAMPFSLNVPVGTHVFGQVYASPGPPEVRFESPSAAIGNFGGNPVASGSVSSDGGTATAIASLATGELKGLALSPTDPTAGEIAHTESDFADQIRIVNMDGSDITGPVTGTVRMHMGGTLTLGRPPVLGGSDSSSRLVLSVAPLSGANFTTDVAISVDSNIAETCPVTDCVIANTPVMFVSQDVMVPFIATVTVDVIHFEAYLDVFAQALANADIFNTASLFIDLPDGYTFVSDSGVLLTQRPAAEVPEPSTWLLLGLGLAGLAAPRRWIRSA